MPTTAPIDAQGQPIFEVQLQAISEALAGNGIDGSGDLAVSAGTGDLEIDITTGSALYGTDYGTLSATATKTLSSGGANDDRWDTVAFDVSGASVVVHEGTPDPEPVAPRVQDGEVLLAVVYVESEATAIADADILNWRLPAGYLNVSTNSPLTINAGSQTIAPLRETGLFGFDYDRGLTLDGNDNLETALGNALGFDANDAIEVTDSSINTAELVDSAVTAAKIASDAVTSTEISDDAVTTAAIAASAVTASEISAGAVGVDELADALGTSSSSPIPGTTHFDAVDTDKVKTTGYSWGDQSGSRSFDTWYQAPSDQDIWFCVTATASSDATKINLAADVNTTQTNQIIANDEITVANGQNVALPSIRVPAGHYYKCRAFGDTADFSIDKWTELR